MVDPFCLAGRRALVTGANTGLGRAIAVSLARQGTQVHCAGRSSCEEDHRHRGARRCGG